MKFYAGIGSRKTPKEVQTEMSSLGGILEGMGYTLRSGNAEGADQAFASGVGEFAQIWLPWIDFNFEFQYDHTAHDYMILHSEDREAHASVDKFHPNPQKLYSKSRGAMVHKSRLLMARNYRQIVGLDEPDSEFVICWTPSGELRGGTAQAVRIANSRGIPVYNMFDFTAKEILSQINKTNMIL